MAAPITSLIDMSDPENLTLYSQVLLFKHDSTQQRITFKDKPSVEQRILQILAHAQELEYEYSVARKTVTISRPCAEDTCITASLGQIAPCAPEIRRGEFDFELASSGTTDFPDWSSHAFTNNSSAWLDQSMDILSPSNDASSLLPPVETRMTNSEDALDPTHDSNYFSPFDPIDSGNHNHSALDSFPSSARANEADMQNLHVEATPAQKKFPVFTFGNQKKSSSQDRIEARSASFSSDVNRKQRYKRVLKACDRCRMKKTRCDGKFPCKRCKDDGVVCSVGALKRTEFKQMPRGLIATVQKLYTMLRNKETWELGEPVLNDKGQPGIHDIVSKLGCIRTVDTHNNFPESPDDFAELQSQSGGGSGAGTPVLNKDGYSSNQSHSRASSARSVQSGFRQAAGEFFNRKPSLSQRQNSGYQEIVFDSNSVHSESGTSVASGASGRRGPLTELARAGMNAVKKVGACWRCKFLRKTCDAQSPCALCPKNDQSNWGNVRCNRGDFKFKQVPLKLCLAPSEPIFPLYFQTQNPEDHLQTEVTNTLESSLSRRSLWINDSANLAMTTSPPREDGTSQANSEHLGPIITPPSWPIPPLPGTLEPLTQCILAIEWELIESPYSRVIIGDSGIHNNLARLLPVAAVYQASLDSDQLIPQSLICLRVCLEALRAKESGFLERKFHQTCTNTGCQFECLNLNMPIGIYLDELSRVFFKKSNLRNKDNWWLSTFYSLCIQSFVRRALIALADTSDANTSTMIIATKQYLYLPLRLFIASSGSFDPLKDCFLISTEDYGSAARAVDRSTWGSNGIQGSGDYLKRLFDDHGDYLTPWQNQETSDQYEYPLIQPMPSSYGAYSFNDFMY